MSQTPTSPSLSEISHLFLTDVRQRQTRGAVRPVRIPPGGPRLASGADAASTQPSIDLTPEEFAMSLGVGQDLQVDQEEAENDEKEPADEADGLIECEASDLPPVMEVVPQPLPSTPVEPPDPADSLEPSMPLMDAASEVTQAIQSCVEAQDADGFSFDDLPSRQVALVFAQHLAKGASQAIYSYGRHLAEEEGQVAMLHVSGETWRLVWFDASQEAQSISEPQTPGQNHPLTPQSLYEALQEMSWDTTRWLVWIENAQLSDSVLAAAAHGVLLCTADHDGIIACYRTLKGLSSESKMPLSLAVMDCHETVQSQRAWRKLSAVSEQFLNRALANEGAIVQLASVNVQTVWSACPSEGEVHSDCWLVVERWLSMSQAPRPRPQLQAFAPPSIPSAMPIESKPSPLGETMKIVETPAEATAPTTAAGPSSAPVGDANETQVLELNGDGSCTAILSAVTRQSADWIECPLQPPMCPAARIAVSRDRRLTMLAVAGQGLRELKAIGQGYRWISENRDLIRMALPQFAIDTSATPMLRLFVDHNDLSADALQSMIHSEHVTLHPYRRLRWGTRTGLMLEAA